MKNYNSKNFNLNIKTKKDSVHIIQDMSSSSFTTKDIPNTFAILEKRIPTIFDNECFNENNYPFIHEVKKTEVGHLFEHLILEHMKIESQKLGVNAEYNGETSWNWETGKNGQFNIQIYFEKQNRSFFNKSLFSSIDIIEEILNSKGS